MDIETPSIINLSHYRVSIHHNCTWYNLEILVTYNWTGRHTGTARHPHARKTAPESQYADRVKKEQKSGVGWRRYRVINAAVNRTSNNSKTRVFVSPTQPQPLFVSVQF
jgi:hypothetical protein